MKPPEGYRLLALAMLAPYHRALLQAVTMAEISHKLKFYEMTAVRSRRVAENVREARIEG